MKNRIISIQHYHSPMGELLLGSLEEQLCLCDWLYRRKRKEIDLRITRGLSAEIREEASPVLQETQKQLEAYFHRELEQFSLPLLCVGTDFQQQVWQALQTIPYGSTESYLGLSKQLGKPKAIRAVASANGANALAIIIPCHRIIGSGQELVGYAGGIGVKKRLLALEQQEQLSLFEDLK